MGLLEILLILFVCSLLFGAFGGAGYYGWSPAGILLFIILILLLTGGLHV